MANLVAGDSFDAQLEIVDSGSLDLRYAMTSSASGSADLASTLQVAVRTKTSNACSVRDGSTLYSGPLSGAAIGDPTYGAQAGDRTLASGGSESLCFAVTLPTSATSTVAAQSVSATFDFLAEQS